MEQESSIFVKLLETGKGSNLFRNRAAWKVGGGLSF